MSAFFLSLNQDIKLLFLHYFYLKYHNLQFFFFILFHENSVTVILTYFWQPFLTEHLTDYLVKKSLFIFSVSAMQIY
jgi:hypothetical protein